MLLKFGKRQKNEVFCAIIPFPLYYHGIVGIFQPFYSEKKCFLKIIPYILMFFIFFFHGEMNI